MTTTQTESAPTTPRDRPGSGWPWAGRAQARLLGGCLVVLVGSFLPWVDTAAGTFTGMAGPGVWTLYAAVLGLGGAVVRRPRVVAVHALACGIVATALPLWQGLRLVRLCASGACLPGIGLLVVLGGGVLVLAQARRLWGRGGAVDG